MRPQRFLVPLSLFFIGVERVRAVPYSQSTTLIVRDLFGLLGGESVLPNPVRVSHPPAVVADLVPTPTTTYTEARPRPLQGTTSIGSEQASISVHSVASAKPTVSTIFDTDFVVQTITPGSVPDTSTATPSSTGPAATELNGDASTTPPAELTEWKVIGIGVITVTLIAIIILSISFFDSWWGFIRSVICGKQPSPEGEETMVPDWHRGSWEFRVANEDGHRYPTLSSLESIVKEKEYLDTLHCSQFLSARVTTPEQAYGGQLAAM